MSFRDKHNRSRRCPPRPGQQLQPNAAAYRPRQAAALRISWPGAARPRGCAGSARRPPRSPAAAPSRCSTAGGRPGPAAWRRPSNRELQWQRRPRCRSRAPQQLDVRVAADHAGRGAWRIEQDAIEAAAGRAEDRRWSAARPPTSDAGACAAARRGSPRSARPRRRHRVRPRPPPPPSPQRSSICTVLPPGAAQASSTRIPGPGIEQRSGQLRAGILHRDQSLGEARQLRRRPGARQCRTAQAPTEAASDINSRRQQLLVGIARESCATGPPAGSSADGHCWPPAICGGRSRPHAAAMRSASQGGCAVRTAGSASTAREQRSRSRTYRRSTALTRPPARGCPEDPGRIDRGVHGRLGRVARVFDLVGRGDQQRAAAAVASSAGLAVQQLLDRGHSRRYQRSVPSAIARTAERLGAWTRRQWALDRFAARRDLRRRPHAIAQRERPSRAPQSPIAQPKRRAHGCRAAFGELARPRQAGGPARCSSRDTQTPWPQATRSSFAVA